jgi:hypothetical protein
MTAIELRIGNYVLRNGFLQEHKETFNEIVVSHNDITACVVSSESFKPIPLTEEWLLKFGFEKNKEHGYFEFDRLIVAIHDGVNQFYLCDIDIFVKIETVHHLQNLYFAIRNKELTLNP